MKLNNNGFTLLEVLVAVALMTVIIVMITIISTGSQEVYNRSESEIEIQEAQAGAFSQMENDIRSIVKTISLEFYDDKNHNQAYDEGELLNVDERIAYRKSDETDTKDIYTKFGYAGDSGYDRCFAIKKDGDNDRMYFKTIVSIEGEIKPVIIEYYLKGDVKIEGRWLRTLVRKILYRSKDKATGKTRFIYEECELCEYVEVFRISYFEDNNYVSTPTSKEFIIKGNDGEYSVAESKLSSKDAGFGYLSIGDKIYLNAPPDIPAGLYTIKGIAPDGKSLQIDYPQATKDVTSGVEFKGAYLPSSIKIEIKVTDKKKRQARWFSRVFDIARGG